MNENKIDLIEVIIKIYNKRLFIITFVGFFTLLATIYSYIKTPVYEARAMVKLGSYFQYTQKRFVNKLINNELKVNNIAESFIEDNKVIIEKIKLKYINKEFNNGKITYISQHNKIKEYIYIRAQSESSIGAKETIRMMISQVSKEFNTIPNDLLDIKIEKSNSLLKQINLVNQSILSLNKSKEIITNIIKNKKISKIKKNDNLINEYHLSLLNERYYDSKIALNELEENKMYIDREIEELKNRNIKLVDGITVNNNPVKPNKFKIILMSMIASLFLSLFLLPFLNIIKTRNSES